MAGDHGDERDAVALALAIALAEAACHNPVRARQALEAAEALGTGAPGRVSVTIGSR